MIVSSPYVKNLDIWKDWGATVTINNNDVAVGADTIVLAVKPHILKKALSTLDSSNSSKIKNKLFISILAGFKLEMLENVSIVFAKLFIKLSHS